MIGFLEQCFNTPESWVGADLRHLSARLDTSGTAHHGSLAHEHRLAAEARLKDG
ncbi:MAG: hypothetical protein ACREX8_16360 [Gammaproteobacteria bacterium]